MLPSNEKTILCQKNHVADRKRLQTSRKEKEAGGEKTVNVLLQHHPAHPTSTAPHIKAALNGMD